MDFQEYEERAWNCAMYYAKGRGDTLYPFWGLAGEAGEICNKIKKEMRDGCAIDLTPNKMSPEKRSELMYELGDVLWYINACAKELGCTLEEVAANNIVKLESRKARNTIQGSGDNR